MSELLAEEIEMAYGYERHISPAAFDERPVCSRCDEVRPAVNDNGVCRHCVLIASADCCGYCGAPSDEPCQRGCKYGSDDAIEAEHVGVRGRS